MTEETKEKYTLNKNPIVHKIGIALILFLLALIFVFLPFSFVYLSSLWPLSILILILFIWRFTVKLSRKPNWKSWLLAFVGLFWFISLVLVVFVFAWNNYIGSTCKVESDCLFKACQGVGNKYKIQTSWPWPLLFEAMCLSKPIITCEQNHCMSRVPSEKESGIMRCEKEKDTEAMDYCLLFLADQLKDVTLCERIKTVDIQSECLEELK